VHTYALARNYENYNSKRPLYDNQKMGFKTGFQYRQQSPSTRPIQADTKLPSTSKWEKGKFFKCQEPCVPGHSKVCKFKSQVHLITIADDHPSDTEAEATPFPDQEQDEDIAQALQLSLHAIFGIATKSKTFPLFVIIGNTKLVALIDSGSTGTFIDPLVLMKTNSSIQNHNPIKVTVANGNTMWTQAMTPNYKYSIQGHQFTSDFRILELEGYDIIFGCDWIFEFSLVGINLKTRDFTIEKDGEK
jgi:hypothetical protein